MFWKFRSKQEPDIALISLIFGNAVASNCKKMYQNPALKEQADLFVSAANVASRFKTHRSSYIARLYSEVENLRTAYPAQREQAILGYASLISIIDKSAGTLYGLTEDTFLTLCERLFDHSPIYNWSPVKKYTETVPKKMPANVRMWSWHHLALVFGISIANFGSIHRGFGSLQSRIIEPEFFRIGLLAYLSAYYNGWMSVTQSLNFLSDEQGAATQGLEILVQRFDGGRAIGFASELLATSQGKNIRNYIRPIQQVLTAREDLLLIPQMIREEADTQDFYMIVAIQSLIESGMGVATFTAQEYIKDGLVNSQSSTLMKDPFLNFLE